MIRFTLRPSPYSRRYVLVTILPTDAAFRAYVRRRGRSCGRYAKGMNMGRVSRGDYPRGYPWLISEIVLQRGFLVRKTTRIVTHELAHAAFAWAKIANFRAGLGQLQPVNARSVGRAGALMARTSPEERFCYAIGDMAADCVRKLYERGVLK